MYIITFFFHQVLVKVKKKLGKCIGISRVVLLLVNGAGTQTLILKQGYFEKFLALKLLDNDFIWH